MASFTTKADKLSDIDITFGIKNEIEPEELTENGYVLLDCLGYKKLIPFVRTYINKKTASAFFIQ